MAYLFAHFTNDEKGKDLEHIWFSVSRDGLNWTDLGSREPILSTCLGTTGIRDPFIVYDKKLKKYFIIATDLCTTKGGDWYEFSHKGSRSLFVWESEDLVNWSEPRLVELGIERAGCVWAPEAVYCNEEDKWLVFWASNVREKGAIKHKQRIYASFTKDFVSFTPAFKYIERKTSLIDTNIVWDNGVYYRFTKDETNKKIIIEACKQLVPENGEEFELLHSEFLEGYYGLEGPECYRLPDGRWCLIVDRYHEGKGYLPVVCNKLETGDFYLLDEKEYNMGKRKKRHGGVIEISDEEYERLVEKLGVAE